MSEEKNSYLQIIKATTILGGVQILNIIIGIIRYKLVAVLLGPLGMGINTLLTTTIGFIGYLTNLGLGTSAVKNVAEAQATGNKTRIAIITTVIKRWVWITGLLGTILAVILSSTLSKIAFGNTQYTWAFVLISITLLFNQITTGQSVILQGMRQLKYLAKASLWGSISGLIISIPIYYLFNLKGIVPAIIASSISALLINWYFAHKVKIQPLFVSKARTIAEGKSFLKMGLMINISGLLTIATSYILRIFISNTGGIEQVGFYSAGFVIITNYVGLVLNAMATEYYPRLSSIASNNELCKKTINEQAEIVTLILTPIVLVFLLFTNWIIVFLYSEDFLVIKSMLQWAVLGMIFRASSWAIAFIFLAKGESKLFFINELLANIYFLAFNILGYYWGQLEGLGISFLLAYFIYLIQVFLFAYSKYSFSFNRSFFNFFILQLIFVILCFVLMKLLNSYYSYFFTGILTLISLGLSIAKLNKLIDLKNIKNKIFNKL